MKFKSKSLEIGRIKVKLSPKEPPNKIYNMLIQDFRFFQKRKTA
jgi:hypothetical protein